MIPLVKSGSFMLILIHIVLELRCNMMDILHTETSQKRAIHIGRLVNVLKHNNISYKCTIKSCKARVTTDSIVKTQNEHNHVADVQKTRRLKNYGYGQGKSLEMYLVGLLPPPHGDSLNLYKWLTEEVYNDK